METLNLKDLSLTSAGRFKLPADLKDVVLPKYPRPNNIQKGTFSCTLQQLKLLKSGHYKYLIYSTGKEAYLFDANLFKEKVREVVYGEYGELGFPKTTYVGYIKNLITEKKYIDMIELQKDQPQTEAEVNG